MKPLPGDKYKHFKGGEYIIVANALNSETLEELVVYRQNDKFWVRLLKEFNDIHPSGVKRFELIK